MCNISIGYYEKLFRSFAATSSSRLLNILGNVVKITAAVISPAAKSAIPSDI